MENLQLRNCNCCSLWNLIVTFNSKNSGNFKINLKLDLTTLIQGTSPLQAHCCRLSTDIHTTALQYYSASRIEAAVDKSCFNSFYISYTCGARCWWRSWLRHCSTSRKMAGSIPDSVIGIFHWHNPSGRTMNLGLTQPLTEMSTRNISWG